MRLICALAFWGMISVSSAMAQPADSLLPPTTKSFLCADDYPTFRQEFDKTQYGKMYADPIATPFLSSLADQWQERFAPGSQRLGIRFDDLSEVGGKEVCLAAIQPKNEPKAHAQVWLIDASGKIAAANALLAREGAKLVKERFVRSSQKEGAVALTVYTQPAAAGAAPVQVVHILHGNRLIVANHLETAVLLVKRLSAPSAENLAGVKAYQESMKRAKAASAGVVPHLRWFREPLGLMEVRRAARGGLRPRRRDRLEVLRRQGFNGIQGEGGYLFCAPPSVPTADIVYKGYVYAPPPFKLAARMLNFPNGGPIPAPAWVPDDVAQYMSFNWMLRDAFEYSKTLIDDWNAEMGLFDDILESLRTDPSGPKINVRQAIVAHLGTKAHYLTDYVVPPAPGTDWTKAERWLLAFETTNEAAARAGIDQLFRNDPQAKKHEHDGIRIYELEDDADNQANRGGRAAPRQRPAERRPNRTMLVAHGHLMIASHVDYAIKLLSKAKAGQTLGSQAEYHATSKELNTIGAGQDSFHYFARTQKSYRVDYENMKRGTMNKSESQLARMLNEMFDDPNQKPLDGSKMPEFSAVEKYFRPSGAWVRSESDGWQVNGFLLP